MPVITQRGKSFQATVAYKRGRYRRQFATEAEARAWGHDAKARLMRGEQPEQGDLGVRKPGLPHTIGELRDYVVATYWRAQKAPETSEKNARAVVEFFGAAKPVHKIDAMDVGRMTQHMLKVGNANATVNRKLAALKRMLTVAQRLDVIAKRPHIELLPENERRRFRLTRDVEDQLIAWFKSIDRADLADLVPVAIDTGIRMGEAARLRFSDVGDGFLSLYETKGGTNRTVPLTSRAKAILARRKGDQRGSAAVFPDLDIYTVDRQFVRARNALGLHGELSFVPHIMRHEFCSRLADLGIAAQTIQKLAGHSSITTTMRYVHMSPAPLGAAIAALELSASA